MAEVVEELVAQAFTLVGAGDETGDVQQLDGDAALAVEARAVVGTASIRYAMAGASTVNLQVAYGALRVDGGEAVSTMGWGSARTRASGECRGVRGLIS